MFSSVKSSGLYKLKSHLTVIFVALAMMFATQNAFANSKYAAFVYDVNRGKVLFSRNADSARFPASLTKMMTLYMVFDAIDAGKISLSTRMKVSKRATSMQPSKLYLKRGSTIRVKDAILALVTKSANDVAVVVAEHLGGNEANFAKMMTRKARSVGMSRTTFKNASGLPNAQQRTTARDMARLGLAIRKAHPKSFRYFATRSFKYAGKTYRNHNRLLGRIGGVNGIKTGYIRSSGFNLVTNLEKNGRHLVAVVMGGRSGAARNAHMTNLIHRNLKKASRKNYAHKITPLLSNQAAFNVASAAPRPVIRPDRTTIVTAALASAYAPKTKKVESKSPVIISADLRTNTVAEKKFPAQKAADKNITKKVTDTATEPETDSSKKIGWKIQISATPTLSSAKELLEEASQKGASVLSSKTPYTELVQKGSKTLYRVRFAGFEDKNKARNACKVLKRKRYSCIYIN